MESTIRTHEISSTVSASLLAIFFSLLITNALFAQDTNIAQFAIWKPNRGQEQTFEAGYKRHLKWHEANEDPWDWYGWYIVSGPRYGQFVDATFDHAWSEFDTPIKPAEDRADNFLHVFPFGELQTVFKVSKVSASSSTDTTGLKSRYLRLITLSVSDVSSALRVLDKLRDTYLKRGVTRNFVTFKVVDGGDTNQIIVILGFSNYNEYGKTATLQEDFSAIEISLSTKVLKSAQSETLVYRADMSLFSK